MFQFLDHSKRVMRICTVVAKALSIPEEDIEISALLHDLGKIYVPNEILNKPSPLTEHEMIIMREHVNYSVEHLKKQRALPYGICYPLNEKVVRIISEHHENYDGSGYFGKKGCEICEEAKILRIADCYDALVSKRVYKDAVSHSEAIRIMTKENRHFDPQIFDIYVNHLSEQVQQCTLYKEDRGSANLRSMILRGQRERKFALDDTKRTRGAQICAPIFNKDRRSENMLKKIGLASLVGCILLSSLSFANEITFKDTEKHWSKFFVERLAKEGYVKGNNGYFKPDEALKTEDFLIMALKVVKPEYKNLSAAEGETYYKPYMDKALEVGLIRDASYDEVPQYEGRMMPRELAVQVVDRALTLMGDKSVANKDLAFKFKDYGIINDINKDAVLRAYELGIIKGSNGNFEPKNPLTRAEAAVLITKLMDKSMRDSVTVSKNSKDYGETVNYFLKAFLAQVKSKTVVIEKDKNGLKNSGDVWYSEKPIVMKGKLTNWWTDQEFEDQTTGKSANNLNRHNNCIGLGVEDLEIKEWLGLDRVGGSFIPYNGELMFINVDSVQDGKAKRFYEMPQKNLNRLAYDLAKYSTQYAETNGYYAQMFTISNSHMYFGVSTDYDHYTTGIGYVSIDTNPKEAKELSDLPFEPQINFCVESGQDINKHSAYILQTFKRVYGDKDGEAIFKMFKEYCQGKDRYSANKRVYKTYNGIKLCFADGQGVSPTLDSTLK